MKRKYTLKELNNLNDNNKLEGKDLGGGLKIGVVGFGWTYNIYNEGSLVYVGEPYRLTLGLLRKLNKLLKEKRNEK